MINTADAKGYYHARVMRELTARHGYYYGAATIGAFYNFRLMLGVAQDMEAICPNASPRWWPCRGTRRPGSATSSGALRRAQEVT
ncbi:MAG: hypothetical protein M3442_13480, partial [Chloroflexota bacterium]|nr:hypothetical protein [Chloroflexota bacterium]